MPILLVTWHPRPGNWTNGATDVFTGLTQKEAEIMKEIYINTHGVKGVEIR